MLYRVVWSILRNDDDCKDLPIQTVYERRTMQRLLIGFIKYPAQLISAQTDKKAPAAEQSVAGLPSGAVFLFIGFL